MRKKYLYVYVYIYTHTKYVPHTVNYIIIERDSAVREIDDGAAAAVHAPRARDETGPSEKKNMRNYRQMVGARVYLILACRVRQQFTLCTFLKDTESLYYYVPVFMYRTRVYMNTYW